MKKKKKKKKWASAIHLGMYPVFSAKVSPLIANIDNLITNNSRNNINFDLEVNQHMLSERSAQGAVPQETWKPNLVHEMPSIVSFNK